MSAGYHWDDDLQQRAYDHVLMRRLVRYAHPYRHMLYLSGLLLAALSVLNNVTPLLIMHAVDAYINNPARMQADAAVEALRAADRNGLFWVMIALSSLMLGQAVVRYFQVFLVSLVGQKCMYDMRIELFDHLQRQSLSFIDHNPAGRLLNRITNDIEKIQQTIVGGVIAVISDLLTIIVVLAVMLYVNWKLALLALSPVPFIFCTSLIFRKYAQHSFLEARAKIARLTALVQEHVSGMRIIQLFHLEQRAFNEYANRNADHRDEWLRQVRNFAVYFPTVEFFSTLSTAFILLYCGASIMLRGAEAPGGASVGAIFAFILLSDRFFGPIRALADRYNLLLEAMAASERVFKLLDMPPDICDSPDAPEAPAIKGNIVFDHVWFSYQSAPDDLAAAHAWALRDISLEIRAGEHIAIVGHTGAGKSSLLHLLSRFYDVQRGQILIDGKGLRDYGQRQLRKQIGVVLQEPFLFSGTIAANIHLGDEAMSSEHIRASAAYVNADEFIMRLPGGYDYVVGERGCNLSAGQRQLVSFARALAHDPAVLVLDEATSNIDSETERLIQDAMGRMMRSRTSIVVAHRLSTIRNADRIIVMHHGRVHESGTHEQLLAKQGIYAALHQLQYCSVNDI